MTTQHTFANGKYTIINDNGKLTSLRYGEPWDRDLTGDSLVYWMLVEVDQLKAELANKALDRKAENARELGLDYEPVKAPEYQASHNHLWIEDLHKHQEKNT